MRQRLKAHDHLVRAAHLTQDRRPIGEVDPLARRGFQFGAQVSAWDLTRRLVVDCQIRTAQQVADRGHRAVRLAALPSGLVRGDRVQGWAAVDSDFFVRTKMRTRFAD